MGAMPRRSASGRPPRLASVPRSGPRRVNGVRAARKLGKARLGRAGAAAQVANASHLVPARHLHGDTQKPLFFCRARLGHFRVRRPALALGPAHGTGVAEIVARPALGAAAGSRSRHRNVNCGRVNQGGVGAKDQETVTSASNAFQPDISLPGGRPRAPRLVNAPGHSGEGLCVQPPGPAALRAAPRALAAPHGSRKATASGQLTSSRNSCHLVTPNEHFFSCLWNSRPGMAFQAPQFATARLAPFTPISLTVPSATLRCQRGRRWSGALPTCAPLSGRGQRDTRNRRRRQGWLTQGVRHPTLQCQAGVRLLAHGFGGLAKLAGSQPGDEWCLTHKSCQSTPADRGASRIPALPGQRPAQP